MTRIRELRQGRNLMIIELAFATRIHPSQLSAIERSGVKLWCKVTV